MHLSLGPATDGHQAAINQAVRGRAGLIISRTSRRVLVHFLPAEKSDFQRHLRCVVICRRNSNAEFTITINDSVT